MKEFDVYLMIDENGDYVVCADESDLAEKYDDEIGGGADLARRIVKVMLTIPVPKTLVLTATLPDVPNDAKLVIA
jgi:hypothetical protein